LEAIQQKPSRILLLKNVFDLKIKYRIMVS
jgi:hypothetical protein